LHRLQCERQEHRGQRWWRVELPLAVPLVVAGLGFLFFLAGAGDVQAVHAWQVHVENHDVWLQLPRQAPMLKAIIDEEALFYHVIRDILVAHLHGNAAQISVEIGRGSVPSEAQPTFQELEKALDSIPPDHG